MKTHIHFFIITRSVLFRMRNVSDKSCRENQNTHLVFSNYFFLQNGAVYEIMWKNNVHPGRPQMTIWRACALHAGYLRLQIHTLRICNTYSFSTATVVAQTGLNVTLCVHCLYCYKSERFL